MSEIIFYDHNVPVTAPIVLHSQGSNFKVWTCEYWERRYERHVSLYSEEQKTQMKAATSAKQAEERKALEKTAEDIKNLKGNEREITKLLRSQGHLSS